MRKVAALVIMFGVLATIIGGCDRQLLIELGILPPDETEEKGSPPDSNAVAQPVAPEPPASALPASPSPPATPTIHAVHDFVPADMLCVITLQPHRAMMTPAVARLPLREMLIRMGQADIGVDFRSPGLFLYASNAFLEDLDEVVLLVDGLRFDAPTNTPADQAGENDPAYCGNIVDGYVLRFRGRAPQTAARQMIFRRQLVNYEGAEYYGSGHDTSWGATYFPDDRTIILGEETVVRKMIRAQKSPELRRPASEYVTPNYELSVRLDWQGIWRRLPLDLKQDPRGVTLANTLTTAKLAARMSERPTLAIQLQAKNAEAGRQLEQFVRSRLQDFRNEVFDNPLPGPWEVVRRDVGRRAAKDLRVERIQDRVELSLVDSFSLEDLMASTQRWVAVAQGQPVDLTGPASPTASTPPAAAAPSPPSGVASGPSTPSPPGPSSPAPAPATPSEVAVATTEILRQIPTAAGIRLSEYLAFMQSNGEFGPRDFGEQTLTVGLLCTWKYEPDVEAMYPERFREFRFTTPGAPDPRQIAGVMSRSSWQGYCTMLQPELVTNFTCDIEGTTARGRIAFQAPNLYQGDIGYTARKHTTDSWRVVSFELPAHGWRFALDSSGRWRWHDAFGDASNPDRCSSRRTVIGRVTLDGRPQGACRLEFFHQFFPEWPFDNFSLTADVSNQGLYSVEVPPGVYYVRVRGQGTSAIPPKFQQLNTSGLRMTVDAATRVVDFDMKSR